MPKPGQAFPVDAEWKRRVRLRMAEAGLDQKALARAIGCRQSTLSALLSASSKHSTLVPAIHAALKWPSPGAPIASADAAEILYLLESLPEEDRRLLLEQARSWHSRRRG